MFKLSDQGGITRPQADLVLAAECDGKSGTPRSCAEHGNSHWSATPNLAAADKAVLPVAMTNV